MRSHCLDRQETQSINQDVLIPQLPVCLLHLRGDLRGMRVAAGLHLEPSGVADRQCDVLYHGDCPICGGTVRDYLQDE